MIQGYLFLNDVLDAFGLEKVPEGQVLGWIRKRGKTTVISVGYDVVYNLIDSVSRVDGYLVE